MKSKLIYKALISINETYKFEVRGDGTLIWLDDRPKPSQEVIEQKIKEIELKERIKKLLFLNNKEFERRVNKLTEQYPEREIQTWTKQEEEARNLLKDATTPTPLLDSLAKTRGIDKFALAKKIVQKANMYASAVGSLLGKKQKIEDIISSISSIEEIKQINIVKLWDS